MSTSGRFKPSYYRTTLSHVSTDPIVSITFRCTDLRVIYHCRSYSHGPLDRPSNMVTRLDQTSRGRLQGNSFDPHLTYMADTYFDRGCSTMVTKVKITHLIWASSISCQRESVAADYSWHCLLPKICSLPNRIVPLHHLLLTFQTSPGKPQTLQLIHVGPRLPFAFDFSTWTSSSFHCSCRFPSFIGPRIE